MLKRKEVSLFAPLGIVLIFQLHLDAAWRRPLAQMTAILAASLGSVRPEGGRIGGVVKASVLTPGSHEDCSQDARRRTCRLAVAVSVMGRTAAPVPR
jgi:hypothetical protein